MRVAGVARRVIAEVEPLDIPQPREPGAGEVLIRVRAAGVCNWDQLARDGGGPAG